MPLAPPVTSATLPASLAMTFPSRVMPALVAGIHVLQDCNNKEVDGRDKCHDRSGLLPDPGAQPRHGGKHMPRDSADRLAIRDVVENWVIWRDARMWDRFRTLWHKDGRMWATWFQGTYEEFIKVSQEGFDRGVRIMHMLGGMSIDIK